MTAIYLDLPLPASSSHLLGTAGQAICSPTVLLRIEFTGPNRSRSAGELLPHLSTLTGTRPAVYFCCTCPEVAFGGCYPLSLPYGARTFLTLGRWAFARGCPACLPDYFTQTGAGCQIRLRGRGKGAAAARLESLILTRFFEKTPCNPRWSMI